MSAKEIAKAKKIGKEWISGELVADSFTDYAFEQVMEAEREPDKHWLVRDKAAAMKAARAMLKDYAYELWRQFELHDLLGILKDKGLSALGRPTSEQHELTRAMTNAAREMLESKNVQSWLADEILRWSLERAGKVG